MTKKTPEQEAAEAHAEEKQHWSDNYAGRRKMRADSFLAGVAWRDKTRFVEPVNPELERIARHLILRLNELSFGDDVAVSAEIFMRQNGLKVNDND